MADSASDGPVGWPGLRALPAGAELATVLCSRDLASLDSAELVDAAAAAKRLVNCFEALGLAAGDAIRTRLEHEHQLGDDPTDDTTRHAAKELAAAVGETKFRCQIRLHIVRRLVGELPQLWRLVADGRFDVYQADLVADELVAVVDRSLVPGIVTELVTRLEASTPADAGRGGGFGLVGVNATATRRLVRTLVAQAEPEQTDEKFKRAFAARRVSVEPGDAHGMGVLRLDHSIDRLAGIRHRLGLIAQALPADDPRTMDQKVADLAADVLEGRLVIDTCTSLLEEGVPPAMRPTGVRRRVQVNVTVPIQTLLGVSDSPGETESGDVVPATLARQLASDPDSVWYRLITDRGRFVELSAHTYRPGAALTRTVRARDRQCVGIGCNTPADACDTDHTVAYAAGGATGEANLGPACRADHRDKDGGGFRLDQPEPGVFRWTYPSGHTYTTRPTPYATSTWPTTWTPPASPADVNAGLALLQAQRNCESTWRRETTWRSIAERKLKLWRQQDGDLDTTPDDPSEWVPPDVLSHLI
ncbi:MAG: DUF222 domain-containing protein [Nocardioidaceae bacterium]